MDNVIFFIMAVLLISALTRPLFKRINLKVEARNKNGLQTEPWDYLRPAVFYFGTLLAMFGCVLLIAWLFSMAEGIPLAVVFPVVLEMFGVCLVSTAIIGGFAYFFYMLLASSMRGHIQSERLRHIAENF